MSLRHWNYIKSDYKGADLLLGNGFSIAIHSGFKYDALYDEFETKCSDGVKNIFDEFKTKNFEEILNNIDITKRTTFALGDKFDLDDIEQEVKLGLINAINSIHPKPGEVDPLNLAHLSRQFTYFGDIFTTNYDILLYNIIMEIKDDVGDYFWQKVNDEWLSFENNDDRARRHIFYLHGAIFLFEDWDETYKIIRDSEYPLILTVSDYIRNENEYPLFISEGNYKRKRKAIGFSPYLKYCFDQFGKSNKPLVVFGHSLSPDQDKHIIDSVKNRDKIAIGVYISDSDSAADLERKCDEFRSRLRSDNNHIEFFDSSTIFEFDVREALKKKLKK